MGASTHERKQPQSQTPRHTAGVRAGTPSASRLIHPSLHLQSMIGNQAVLRRLQAQARGREAGSGDESVPRFAHGFSRIPAHAASPATIQAKLRVNTPEDIYE